MPKRLFEQAQITLNTYDISADVHGAKVMVGRRPAVDVTGLANTFDE